MGAGDLPRRWPPKGFVWGCVIVFSSSFLAGAFGRKWIFYLGMVIALPLIALGIRTFFSRMDDRYREDLRRIEGRGRNTDEGGRKE